MSVTYGIDGALFASMLESGAARLRDNAQTVNELNVFPIPDGDTGENMARTVEGGVASMTDGLSDTVGEAAKLAARGMLLSARGNSGVILSQFFEGVSIGFAGVETADVADFKRAFEAGVKQAYSAVVTPTEGTILTVMREAAEKAESVPDGAALERYFDVYMDEMYSSLERTPELLPVLRESGVIDSGGAGFVYIIEGMYDALTGNAVGGHVASNAVMSETAATDGDKFDEDSTMEYGYCTELIVQLMSAKTDVVAYDVKTLIAFLESIGGDSIVAFKTGTRIKLHVHTFEPDKVLAYCRTIGEFVAVKVENMSMQHTEAVVRNRFERRKVTEPKRKKYACVAVADGKGIIDQFYSLGADYVVDGKQTMNPSTQDFITAFDAVNADTVFVLPDNANVIMAAKQAAELYKKSKIIVIESKTLAEGYSALSMHDYSSDDAEEIAKTMTAAAADVTTGLVTYAVRDCAVAGSVIKKGDWMGFAGKELLSCSQDIAEAACGLLAEIDMTGKSVVIAVRGKEYADDASVARIAEYVAKNLPDVEFYDFDGGQDVYSFIFVVE